MSGLKLIHVIAAILSGAGFLARGILMLRDSKLLATRFVRIAPHVNDTVLLGAAIGLMLQIGQYPFVHGWLTAKVIALLVYIGLGMVALRRGHSRRIQLLSFLAALIAFGYIVLVALTRSAALHPAG